MLAIRILFLVALTLFLLVPAPVIAQEKPKDLILGKWNPAQKDEGPVLEFLKDGKFKVTFQQVSFEGMYKFIDDNTMDVEITAQGKTQKDKIKVEVTKDSLTTTDSTGKPEKFTRAK
jgi:uncharacterized protein (TIGR03066 family)